MEKGLHAGLTEELIAAAIEVHRHLGPGLLESAYEACLCRELDIRGVKFRPQVPLTLEYKGSTLDCAYRMDLVVDDRVLLELKSVQAIEPIHEAQILSYLKLSKLQVGLLMNFNVPLLKDGIRRFAN